MKHAKTMDCKTPVLVVYCAPGEYSQGYVVSASRSDLCALQHASARNRRLGRIDNEMLDWGRWTVLHFLGKTPLYSTEQEFKAARKHWEPWMKKALRWKTYGKWADCARGNSCFGVTRFYHVRAELE